MTIIDKPANSATIAYYQRRRLLLHNQVAKFTDAVKNARVKDPDNLNLQLESAEALEINGDLKAARKQLLDIAYKLQNKEPFGEKGQSNKLPDWLIFEIERLKTRSKCSTAW